MPATGDDEIVVEVEGEFVAAGTPDEVLGDEVVADEDVVEVEVGLLGSIIIVGVVLFENVFLVI